MNNLSGSEWFKNSFSIWSKINKTKEERQLKHPAMFPQKLPEKLINIYTRNKGELILDPFMGGGTVAAVCKEMNRKYIGFELNENYRTLIEERLS